MKNKVIAYLVIILSGILLFGCSQSEEEKLAGTWKVEDVKFDSTVPMAEDQVNSAKESAKSVSYVLKEDLTAKVHVGNTILEGNWEYREPEAGVYMSFSDSFDTVLLGTYKEGKLINVATRPDLKITTIFIKEEK